MTPENFSAYLEQNFNFKPTESQKLWFPAISEFLFSKEPNTVFLLKGYAGTGKTTLIYALKTSLNDLASETKKEAEKEEFRGVGSIC